MGGGYLNDWRKIHVLPKQPPSIVEENAAIRSSKRRFAEETKPSFTFSVEERIIPYCLSIGTL